MSSHHRRTRIYGANYDIGESYYKKQLNELDNKGGSYRYEYIISITLNRDRPNSIYIFDFVTIFFPINFVFAIYLSEN